MFIEASAALLIAERAINAAWNRACAAYGRELKRKREAAAAAQRWAAEARDSLTVPYGTPYRRREQ